MEKIEQKFEKGFNRSSKIMEYKIGINEARLLNTLVYKHNYWLGENKLEKIDEGWGFYITIPNLQGETNLSESVIKRCLNKLKKEGLIEVHRKGIPAKNHYVLNKEAIESFDEKNGSEYESWLDALDYNAQNDRARFKKHSQNTSVSLMESKIGQNDLTSEVKMTQLDRSKTTVTKNKITKNKKPIITNRTHADIDFVEFEELLGSKIMELQDTSDDSIDQLCEELHGFICERIPKFEMYDPSYNDLGYLMEIATYNLDSAGMASKIITNLRAICDGSKDARFGNLFVGLREIALNTELKHTG